MSPPLTHCEARLSWVPGHAATAPGSHGSSKLPRKVRHWRQQSGIFSTSGRRLATENGCQYESKWPQRPPER
eukprot:4376592-Pyramimonas_sp.AAC.1